MTGKTLIKNGSKMPRSVPVKEGTKRQVGRKLGGPGRAAGIAQDGVESGLGSAIIETELLHQRCMCEFGEYVWGEIDAESGVCCRRFLLSSHPCQIGV